VSFFGDTVSDFGQFIYNARCMMLIFQAAFGKPLTYS